MLKICTWLWGTTKFGISDVQKLISALSRNIKQPYQFLLVTDRPDQFKPLNTNCEVIGIKDQELLLHKGCFARLRMFDVQWQKEVGFDRLVCIDLDTIITGPLDPLFDRPEPFLIMQEANRNNPCPFNGALMMLTPGVHKKIWDHFSLEAAQKVPFYEFPDDQGWIHHKLQSAAGWKVGDEHGVYVWQKRGWPGGEGLPEGARLVSFVNKHPSSLQYLPWVQEHWQ